MTAMEAWVGWGLLGLILLLGCSALLNGAEAAFFSLGRLRLRRLADTEDTLKAATPLIARPHDLLVTLLVGITLIDIGASAIAASVAEQLLGRWGLSVAIGAMIFFTTVFTEVLPMSLALERAERFAVWVSRPVSWLSVLLAPARSLLVGLTAVTLKALGSPEQREPLITEEELRTLVDVGAREGVVERTEREMIHKVFELEDTLVREVMVPRPDMFCLDISTPPARVLEALREQLHSRVPVYEGSVDRIVGILYTKELLPYVRSGAPDLDLRAHLHPPYFVPESKRVHALLKEFQAKKLHIAIVVDEYGGTAGLVALEDLLEELVGEISDEFDVEERLIQPIDARTYRVSGKLPIDELNAATGLVLSSEAYDTVGGWVLDLFGRIPHRSERIETPEVTVVVEKVQRTRIVEVLVTLRTGAPDKAAA
ncbi:MAG: HlyC/CorC family transporter [Candidatus Rokubacteria bacterium]|nr:HlyC/CorC family transporter [Candidatus Rokubacteria bacterium]